MNPIRRLSEGIQNQVLQIFDRAGSRLSHRGRRRWVRLMLLVQLAVLALIFAVSRDRNGLLLDIYFGTAPGGILSVMIAPYLYGIDRLKAAMLTGRIVLGEVFLGTSDQWLTSGLQAIFLAAYLKEVGKTTTRKLPLFLHSVLFTFFSGALLSLLLTWFGQLQDLLAAALHQSPAILWINLGVKVVLFAVIGLVALDGLLQNFSLYLKTLLPTLLIGIAATGVLVGGYAWMLYHEALAPWVGAGIQAIEQWEAEVQADPIGGVLPLLAFSLTLAYCLVMARDSRTE